MSENRDDYKSPLLGIAANSGLTVEKFLAMTQEDKRQEEEQDERLWGSNATHDVIPRLTRNPNKIAEGL